MRMIAVEGGVRSAIVDRAPVGIFPNSVIVLATIIEGFDGGARGAVGKLVLHLEHLVAAETKRHLGLAGALRHAQVGVDLVGAAIHSRNRANGSLLTAEQKGGLPRLRKQHL